jgi:phosphatidylserine decarboxylase
MNSQSYVAHVAARAVILTEADDPVIGLMAFVPVGMSEVSSCLIDAKITRLSRREGRGTRLLLIRRLDSLPGFSPGRDAEFALAAIPQPHDPNAPLVHVRSRLATANSTG